MMDYYALRGNVVALLESQDFRVTVLHRQPTQLNDLLLRLRKTSEFEDTNAWPEDEKGLYATAQLFEKNKGQPVEIQISFDGQPMGLATAECTLFIFFHTDSRTLSFHKVTDLQSALAAGQYVTHRRGSYRVAQIPGSDHV